jgi:hypothetical protein
MPSYLANSKAGVASTGSFFIATTTATTEGYERTLNDEYLYAEGMCSMDSGAVESTVKPIDRRLKRSLIVR